MCDPTGASNVSSTQSVPTPAPTVSTDGEPDTKKLIDWLKQCTLLPDVHADVLHAPYASAELAVKSKPPKLSPITVTDDPPLGAEFSNPYDNVGASKESLPNLVPANEPTVTVKV